MNDARYKVILYVIVAVIAGTIGIQVYWNIKNYQINKQQLTNEVQASLDNAVETYYANLARENTIGFAIEASSDDILGNGGKFDSILRFIEFEEKGFKIGGNLSKKMDYGPLVSLINGSIKKNEPFLFSNNKSSSSHANSENTKIIDEGMVPTDTSGIEESNLVESTTLSSKNILSKLGKNKSLDSKESLIEELKKQLEIDKLNASTPEEFALIAEREALILALSNELELSKEVIAFKEEQLSTKSKQFWLLMLVLLVVIGAGAYVYLSMRKKAELDSKIIFHFMWFDNIHLY